MVKDDCAIIRCSYIKMADKCPVDHKKLERGKIAKKKVTWKHEYNVKPYERKVFSTSIRILRVAKAAQLGMWIQGTWYY